MMTPTAINIFYATETGTAAHYAHRLRRALQRRGVLHVEAREMSVPSWRDLASPLDDGEDTSDSLEERHADVTVFIISTTGDGEMPNAMRAMWRTLLRSDLTSSATRFETLLPFAIFGLGDSTYEKFNAAARKFKARITQLGAKEVCDAGARDEANVAAFAKGSEDPFDRWVKTRLLPALKLDTVVPNPPSLERLKRSVVFSPPTDSIDVATDRVEEEEMNNQFEVEITVNKRMTSPDWMQDVRHLEMRALNASTSSSSLYQPGDVLLVRPRNEVAVVSREALAKFIRNKLSFPFPVPLDLGNLRFAFSGGARKTWWSVMDFFLEELDVANTPPQDFFEEASFHCEISTESGVEEKEKLLEISRDYELYHAYVLAERRTYLEVVSDFASLRIPFERFVQIVPRIKAREYSIASSPLMDGGEVFHLTVGVLTYLTKLRRVKSGLCSTWLSTLAPGTRMRVGVRREGAIASAYARVVAAARGGATPPLILVGPGTGVAPMRSIYRHETAMEVTRSREEDSAATRKLRLYFGCRKEKHDYLYAEEFRNDAVRVRVAFSRDDPQGNKVYVQSLLKRNGKETCDWVLEEGAFVFISGNAKRMPADVKETFVQMLEKHRGMPREEALAFLKRMEKERRWVVEAFA